MKLNETIDESEIDQKSSGCHGGKVLNHGLGVWFRESDREAEHLHGPLLCGPVREERIDSVQ